MKGKIIISVLLVVLFVWHGESSALVFGAGGGVPERVKKRGLRVSCFVVCEVGKSRSLEEKLDKWIRIYLQGKLKDLKFVDERKVTDEVLGKIPHLTISFKGEGMSEVITAYAYVISVEVHLWGYDVIVEGIHGSYRFWWSHNQRSGAPCDFYEFRELVRPILDEFIYQYLTGR